MDGAPTLPSREIVDVPYMTGPDNGEIDRPAGNQAVLGSDANSSPHCFRALADYTFELGQCVDDK